MFNKSFWNEEICSFRNNSFSKLKINEQEEDVFFIIREKNTDPNNKHGIGTVNMYFAFDSAYLNYELSKAINQDRKALYNLTKHHKGSYFLMGKYQVIQHDNAGNVTAGKIDFSSIVDLTSIFFKD